MKREDILTEYVRPPLPSEYRQVNYLYAYDGSHKGPYIDTCFKASNNTLARIKSQGDIWVLGGRTSAAVGDLFGICMTNIGFVEMQFGNEGIRYYKNNIHSDICEFELSKNGCYINGVLRASFNQHTFNGANNLWLFNLNDNGSQNNSLNGYIWYCQLFENNIIQRDYVPVVRNSDNKPGMWDFCGSICTLTNSPFYVKAGGTGEFTYA